MKIRKMEKKKNLMSQDIKYCVTCANKGFEIGMVGHIHWPSIGDIYSVTEDLAWNDITKVQNILWEQQPGEMEKGRSEDMY